MIIDDLTPTTQDNLTDEIPVEQGTATLKTTWAKVKALFGIDDKLDKSGGTMSGDLTRSGDNNPALIIKNTDMNTSAATLPSTEYATLRFTDNSNRLAGYVQTAEATSGATTITLNARRLVGGSNVDNNLVLRVAADGTTTVTLSDASAWLSALGITFPVPIAQGGTEQTGTTTTTTTSNIISAGAGISISSASYSVWGKLAMLTVVFTSTSAISTSNVTVGTLVSGKRAAQAFNWAESNLRTCGDILANGSVRVRVPVNGSSVPAGTSITLRATYLLA